MTLTTVGYGDIVPKTTAGRLAGVAIMFTGIAVLGVLAGSLSALFRLDGSTAGASDAMQGVDAGDERVLQAELVALHAQLQAVELRLGELANRAGGE